MMDEIRGIIDMRQHTWKVVRAYDAGMFKGETRNVGPFEEMINSNPGYIVQSITSMGQGSNILVGVLLRIDSDEFRAMYGGR